MARFVRPTVQDATAGVIVRRYAKAEGYQVDAGQLAAIGWSPISQTETTGKIPVAAGLMAAIGVLVAFFVNLYAGAAIVIIAVLIGIATRARGMVVTYRYDATRQP